MAILDYVIPGYKGYRLRAESRETDKLFRDYITKLLSEGHQKLETIKVDLTRTGNLMSLNPADSCTKQLTRVRDRLRFANYGFSALFDKGQTKVDHTRLERIEEFDKKMVDQQKEIANQIDKIQSVVDAGDDPAGEFRNLQGFIRTMDEHLNSRERMIRGQE
jgi:hypothetical protein